jgi:hypothetical protein
LYKYPVSDEYKKEGFIFNGLECWMINYFFNLMIFVLNIWCRKLANFLK